MVFTAWDGSSGVAGNTVRLNLACCACQVALSLQVFFSVRVVGICCFIYHIGCDQHHPQRAKSVARDFTLLYIEKEDCGGGPVITEAKVKL